MTNTRQKTFWLLGGLLALSQILISCSKDNGESAPTPPRDVPAQTKATSGDMLHCRYNYLPTSDDKKAISFDEKKVALTYEKEEKGFIDFQDDHYTLTVDYETERNVDNVKDQGLSTGKAVNLQIRFQDVKKSSPGVYISSKVAMGWNMWQVPVDLTIDGENYNRASILCGFFNN